MGDAKGIIKGLDGLDSSGVEVEDEEQVAPTVAANSPEEAALLAEVEAALKATGNEAAINAPTEIKLMCLRGRKYDVARAVDLIPKHLELRTLLELDRDDNERLKEDLSTCKIAATGGKDDGGRAILWIRLRFHDPKKSKALDMGRLLYTIMIEALKDVEVQRSGIVIINDVRGVGLKNLDPAAVKFIMGNVFPAMPVRVGKICLFNPPWVIGHIILPIVLTFLSKKLRGRITVVNGSDTAKLSPFFPSAALPAELGGSMPWDEPTWSAKMIAGLGGGAVPIS